ncbi:hypothetical protein PRIPAC_70792 [Pristionchus pacificus]|uniref:Uncharacterized protein n=1 Tax=Pristionchus pacificus TaxID=54126 RepID=A0A2A6C0R8_PRIPA|nr:hypothetical protein PRIPAC_70792 [Pristionchus pacificus]|eukprot:PDM71740.1 hypothetical protein PRIPAC_38147 [Pristionchus pacificus]
MDANIDNDLSPISIFSAHVFGKICGYLDNNSISQLRQMCKLACKSFSQLFSTRETVVANLNFKKNAKANEIILSITLWRRRDVYLWRLGLICACKTLHLNPSECLEFFQTELNATLVLQDLSKLLEHLKPLTRRTKFMRMRTFGALSNYETIISLCADFLEGKSLRFVSDSGFYQDYDSKIWVDFFRAVKTDKCVFHLKISKESVNFMLHIASIIGDVRIQVVQSLNHDFVPIIREMLKRKCANLNFHVEGYQFSQTDVTRMVQFFHRLDKRCLLILPFDDVIINAQIGVCNLIARDQVAISLAHLSIGPHS